MELEGSLKAFSLPDVLQFLSMNKMSGYLHLSHDSFSLALTIKGGKIVNSSTLMRNRRLGEMLIQRGLLRRRDLEEVLSLQKTIESDKRLGELLVERELIKASDVRDTLRLQLEEEVWDLFSWDEGHFKFENALDQDITNVAVQIDIEPLLLEGSRRQDEWHKIRRSIPDDKVVLGVVGLPQDFQRNIKLSPAEWKVLSTVNAILSITAVVNRCGLGRFETCHILNSFLSQELVRIVDPPTVDRYRKTAFGKVSPEAQALADALMTIIPPEARSTRLGSFFGSKPKAPDHPDASPLPPLNLVVPASIVAGLLSAFVQQTVQNKEFAQKPEDSALLETIWRDIIVDLPRAELLRVSENLVDPSLLEAFVVSNDYSATVQECHEESLEALTKIFRIVYRIGAQRLGEKNVQRNLVAMVESASPRLALRYGSPPFHLSDFINRSILAGTGK